MPHTLHQVMAPIGHLEGLHAGKAMEALCADACTRAAMAGALVATGLSPGEALHTVKAWEGAGLTIVPEVRALEARALRPTRAIDRGIAGIPAIAGIPGFAGVPGIEAMLGYPAYGAMGVPGIGTVGALGVPGVGVLGTGIGAAGVMGAPYTRLY